MLKRNCAVKYVDTLGIEHTVRVEAESLFEAAIRGLQRLDSGVDSSFGDMRDRMFISVEVYAEPTTYAAMVQKLKPWIKTQESHPRVEDSRVAMERPIQAKTKRASPASQAPRLNVAENQCATITPMAIRIPARNRNMRIP